MRIVMASAELSEVAAIGGAGEYTLGLATELASRGHHVEVVLPLYGYLARHAKLEKISDRMIVPLGVGASQSAVVKRWPGSMSGFQVTLIAAHRHFADVRSPGDIYELWPNHEPWIAFARSVVSYVRMTGSDPDIIHCMDSHTALVPVFLHDAQRTRWDCAPAKPATVLTIHNLLNQGQGDPAVLEWAGLQPAYWYHDWFEFYGSANCFKAGLLTADRVNTVSRTYAEEICGSANFGFGLEGILALLRSRRRLEWILNGITPGRWQVPGISYGPEAAASDVRAVKDLKRRRRSELFSGWGWQDEGSPVIACRARWDRQKGVVEMVECIRRSLHAARFIVVTWGDRDAKPELDRAWRTLVRLQAARPDRLLLNPENLLGQMNGAHHYAVADFLLIPSWYEPCGLTQMECQPYGTIPIVRSTGGLADTVSEVVRPDFPSPNGFVFNEPMDEHMIDRMAGAVQRAIQVVDTALGDEMIRHCLQQDNSWSKRAHDYEVLYESAAGSKLDEAIGCLSQRIATKRSQGDMRGEAEALRELGHAYAGRGRLEEAHGHWQHALDLMLQLGSAEAEEIQQLLAP